ncbi:MAG: YheC/YheD family protein [Firmicutes bacterium]|nr:YheC/YheD family protein [Bacillota bacterium]
MVDGPLIGVFLPGEPDRERPFGAMTSFFLRLCHQAPEAGVRVVGLYPEGIRGRDRIQGIAWGGERRGFVTRTVGQPDLIWERMRGGSRRHPVLRLLREWGIPFLNSVTLNKWEGFRVLARDPVVRPFLPETHLLEESEDALGILRRYGRAYVKPVAGAMGRGILRIRRRGRRYLGEYAPGPNRPVRAVDLQGRELEEWLDEQTGKEVYLVQQGLRLEVMDGRTADIRILMQKDGRGRWRVTGMGARLGAPGRYTSNLHTGGQGVPVRWLLGRLLPGDWARQREVEAAARDLAFRICRVLEAETGPLGELGIDLGLEPTGRIWYIEHNYYPGRSILRHLGDEAGYLLAHRRPLEYARWAVERLRRGEPLTEPVRPRPVSGARPQPRDRAARDRAASRRTPSPPAEVAREVVRPLPLVARPPAPGPAGSPGSSPGRGPTSPTGSPLAPLVLVPPPVIRVVPAPSLTPASQPEPTPAPPRSAGPEPPPAPVPDRSEAPPPPVLPEPARERARRLVALHLHPTFVRTVSGRVLRPAPSDRGRLRPAR